ncbi:MAG TPA: alpha-hydroxy acid oxidase [Sphingobium sp.]|nr:alpha-hydroxy acid oxidase [Sphingobium sp.]
MRIRARSRLPHIVYDFVEGGAEGERSAAWNEAAFDQIRFAPRPLGGSGIPSQKACVFGTDYAVPFGIAPTGLADFVWPGTAAALAKLSADVGMPYILSTAASITIEAAADLADGHLWFQLYAGDSRDLTRNLLRRAASAGVDTLVLTVDSPTPGRRRRDLRNGLNPEFRPTARHLADFLRHPRWFAATLRAGRPRLANIESYQAGLATEERLANASSLLGSSRVDWAKLHDVRQEWAGKLIVKGIMTSEEAVGAEAAGAEAVLVSNHGGRVLDGVAATIEIVSDIRSALKASTMVFLDSGIRHGADIVKALALGADFVFLGRPWLYASAALGPAHGGAVLADVLRKEIGTVLAHLGCDELPIGDRRILWGTHNAAGVAVRSGARAISSPGSDG